jgi:hypothetical protein
LNRVDCRPLGGDGRPRLLLALALEARAAVRQRLDLLPPASQRVAESPGAAHDEPPRERVVDAHVAGDEPPQVVGDPHGRDRHGGHDRGAPRGVGGKRVEGDQRGKPGLQRSLVVALDRTGMGLDLGLREHGDDDDGERQRRTRAPPQQRKAGERQQQRVRGLRALDLLEDRPDPHLVLRRARQERHEQDVEEVGGVRARPRERAHRATVLRHLARRIRLRADPGGHGSPARRTRRSAGRMTTAGRAPLSVAGVRHLIEEAT